MPSQMILSPEVQGEREITFGQAIREALAEELRREPAAFVIGEDVAEAGTTFKVLTGLVEEFGPERIIDSPISEAGITGLAVGAAVTGMRPIVDIMFGDFITLTMDQLVNQAAKIHRFIKETLPKRTLAEKAHSYAAVAQAFGCECGAGCNSRTAANNRVSA